MATILHLSLISIIISNTAAFTPAYNYLIDCGSLVDTVIDGRTFKADTPASWSLSAPSSFLASISSNSLPALYNTARVFSETSSYSFPIKNPGRHFIRLYFYPFSYQNHNLTAAHFSVSTQDLGLLTVAPATTPAPFLKEFSLNITRDSLILTFAPIQGSALAFVNAIEVVPVPDDLIPDNVRMLSPASTTYQGLLQQGLETAYRINMGGPKVTPANDTLWRTWVPDREFLRQRNLAKFVSFSGPIKYMRGGATQETAPDIVYRTATELAESSNTSDASFNVTWEFNVDANSMYFVRMHFCDIVSKALNELYFNVYINSLVAIPDLDISTYTGSSLATAYYVDFVVGVSGGSGILRISIGPSAIQNVLPDGILNGLEVMKISNSVFNGQNSSSQPARKSVGLIVGSAIGALAVVLMAALLLMLLKRRRRTRTHDSKSWAPFSLYGGVSHCSRTGSTNGSASTSGRNSGLGFRFSFVVLQESTKKFDENLVVGVGGFGKVYKGVFRDGTKVAVKRANPKSQQGLNEFRTEIELLSRLRHRHLVSLIGYCDESNEMILVYEYMEKGALRNHLYGSDLPHLTWKQRLEICIGSAKGLHYLHTGQAKAVIHRDVKSANILLDENLTAKVADFGLSKTGPELDQTHVSTAVKGSFGYLDPEYFRRQQLTEKSDVYSFGVVLLEVLCARPVIDPTLPRERVNLAEWVMKVMKKTELVKIIDPYLADTIRSDSLRKFGETAEKCLAEYGVDRPTMGDVLWNLEYALQLQEAVATDFELDSINKFTELSSQIQNVRPLERVKIKGIDAASGVDDSTSSMSRVFSQLIKAEGR